MGAIPRNMPAIVVTCEMSHAATSCVNADRLNRLLMSVTAPVSHDDRSWSKLEAPSNMPDMS